MSGVDSATWRAELQLAGTFEEGVRLAAGTGKDLYPAGCCFA
jgi:hypothetical protein